MGLSVLQRSIACPAGKRLWLAPQHCKTKQNKTKFRDDVSYCYNPELLITITLLVINLKTNKINIVV